MLCEAPVGIFSTINIYLIWFYNQLRVLVSTRVAWSCLFFRENSVLQLLGSCLIFGVFLEFRWFLVTTPPGMVTTAPGTFPAPRKPLESTDPWNFPWNVPEKNSLPWKNLKNPWNPWKSSPLVAKCRLPEKSFLRVFMWYFISLDQPWWTIEVWFRPFKTCKFQKFSPTMVDN